MQVCDYAGMSYDLAVWEGPRPGNSIDASAQYEARMEAMEAILENEDGPSPTPAIRAFVEAALARYPELDEASGPECPWASAPLLSEAVGDLIYFPMTFSGAEYARDVLAEIAQSHGLVCYDPQIEQLLPDSNATPASSIGAAAYEAMTGAMPRQQSPAPRRSWLARLLGRG